MKILLLKTPDVPDTEISTIREFLRIYFSVEIETRIVSDRLWEYQEYHPGLWGVDFEEIAALASDANFICLLHIPDRAGVVSFARMTPAGTIQYSQVNATGGYRYNLLHELAHSLHAFYGQEDKTHEFLIDTTPADFGGLYTQIKTFANPTLEDTLAVKLDAFIKKWVGRKVDFDGSYGAQCVDLYRQYVKEVLGFPQLSGVIGAYQILDTVDTKYYQKNPIGPPQPGDIIVWNTQFGPLGHTAITVSANKESVKVFEQNNPPGSACRVWDHNYDYVIGWFRPLQLMETFKMYALVVWRNSKGEISLIGKGKRVPISARVWDILGKPDFAQVSDEQYNAVPLGLTLAGNLNLGSMD